MGRQITADESLQDKVTALGKAGTFQIGLLIGQSTSDKDIIVHLAPTPVPDEGDLSSEDEEAVPSHAEQNKSKFPDSIPKVVESTVSQHARQVVRMLPGGLDIIGVYVVTSQADFTSSASQTKLRFILGATHKTTSRILLETAETRTEKVILHVCTQSFKISCKSLDVSPEATTTQENADLKFQRGGCKWHQLSYTYNINLNFWLPKDMPSQSLYKTIITLLKPWAKNVTQSLILIDSELPDDEDPLDPTVEEKQTTKKKGGNRGGLDLTPPKVFKVEILDPGTPVLAASGLMETTGNIRLSGTLAGLAFVHSKATVGEGRRAVLVDLVRSVVSRWEMHCDSLVEEPPSHLLGPIIHEPPRRVFLEGGGLPVSLCDYLFPGDTCADACQSAKELLSLRIRKEHVDDTQETLADAAEVMCSTDISVNGGEELETQTGNREAPCSSTQLILVLCVAAVGVAVSFISLQGKQLLT